MSQPARFCIRCGAAVPVADSRFCFSCGAEIVSPGLIVEQKGYVIVGSQGEKVYAVGALSGAKEWEYNIKNNPVKSFLTVSGEKVFVTARSKDDPTTQEF